MPIPAVLADILRGADLHSADLRGANLQGATLQEANLSGINLRGANLLGATLQDADLLGANLSCANLQDADLLGANLSFANLQDAHLRDADLEYATLEGAILPTGETYEEYLTHVVPALCTAAGAPLEEVVAAWDCHAWDNCPMAVAFGVHALSEIPLLYRPRVAQFMQLFDAGLLPLPPHR